MTPPTHITSYKRSFYRSAAANDKIDPFALFALPLFLSTLFFRSHHPSKPIPYAILVVIKFSSFFIISRFLREETKAKKSRRGNDIPEVHKKLIFRSGYIWVNVVIIISGMCLHVSQVQASQRANE